MSSFIAQEADAFKREITAARSWSFLYTKDARGRGAPGTVSLRDHRLVGRPSWIERRKPILHEEKQGSLPKACPVILTRISPSRGTEGRPLAPQKRREEPGNQQCAPSQLSAPSSSLRAAAAPALLPRASSTHRVDGGAPARPPHSGRAGPRSWAGVGTRMVTCPPAFLPGYSSKYSSGKAASRGLHGFQNRTSLPGHTASFPSQGPGQAGPPWGMAQESPHPGTQT